MKIVFFIRDPVARAWSHICMSHRGGELDAAILQSPDLFRGFLDKAHFIRDRASPTQVMQRWRRCAPQITFRHYLFDDLQQDSEAVRHKIIGFLGGDPEKPSGPLDAVHNRKADAPMLRLDGKARAVLIDDFRDELLSCAAEYGGRAAEWPAKYGLD